MRIWHSAVGRMEEDLAHNPRKDGGDSGAQPGVVFFRRTARRTVGSAWAATQAQLLRRRRKQDTSAWFWF